MSVIEDILAAIDKLNPDEQYTVYKYLKQKQHSTYWVVSPDNLERIDAVMHPIQQDAANMPEDEILIDEALGKE
jgi:hypothetical protein